MADQNKTILGLGISTIDELLVVERYPRLNEKHSILSRTRQGGGLTGSALVAAARMGCRCEYIVSLGSGELSSFLRQELGGEGVRLVENNDIPETEPFFSIIITERGTGERVILWDNAKARPPVLGTKERAMVLSAGCLFVDHVYATEIIGVVRDARAAGVPVVGDFERTTADSPELMDLTDHIILPLGYAKELFGESVAAKEAAARLAAVRGRSLACVTDGVNGSWYALGGQPDTVYHQPLFPMENVVDTTGCGDVFHGVYAAGLVLGWSPADRIRCASAAAALKTQKQGAQKGAPTMVELERFLESRCK